MAHKDRKSAYEDKDLTDAKWMVEGIIADGYDLEAILKEYGGGAANLLKKSAEETADTPAKTESAEGALPEPAVEEPEEAEPAQAQEAAAEEPAEEEPPHPKRVLFPGRFAAPPEEPEAPETPEEEDGGEPPPPPEPSVEELVSRAIDEVREEEEAARPKQSLFSRRKGWSMKALFAAPAEQPAPEPEEEIGPEEPLRNVADAARRRWKRQRVQMPCAAVLSALMILQLLVKHYDILAVLEERFFLLPPAWAGDRLIQALVLGCTLAVVSCLCWDVFWRTLRLLQRGHTSCDLLVSAAAIVTMADCFTWPVYTQRPEVLPYAAPVCVALTAAMWGEVRRSRAVYETCRTASVTDAPLYAVSDTGAGACKELGRVEGFYTDLMKDEEPVLLQSVLTPVIFVGTLVFSGLASLGKGLDESFLVSWSAVLTASCSLSLPVVWTLPWSGLARQLQKTNAAIAGWAGARAISRRKTVVLSDEDLFPPGTVKINGIKLYGEEMRHAVTYAASIMKDSGSGLRRLFDDLLRSENGRYLKVEEFSFYEEGGFAAEYHGESLLLGTASFMRKMDVRLPGNLNLKTGMFLAVDRQLVAVFAIKYQETENVEWALKMLKRNAIVPILAARDPNITPQLLKRKFSRGVKVTYPALADRLALSELEDRRDRPHAMVMREGLLPFAEVVVGSLRCCKSAREGAVFGLLGSAAGTLLTGYLVNLGAFALMEPLTLLVFLVLWFAPALLYAAWAGKF